MTSELTSEAPRDAAPAPARTGDGRGARVAALHLRLALAFLVVASVLMAIAAGRLVFPDLLSDVAFLAYGRVFPAAIDLFVFGWLTLGLIGAGYHILPRMSGTPLARTGLAVVSGGLLAVAVAAGTVAVLMGANEGRQYLEFPIWVDAVMVVALVGVVGVVTGHMAANKDRGLTPPDWYFGAAVVWLLLAQVAGSIPGLQGVNVSLQSSFYRGALFGLWLAAAGLGVVYYVAARMARRDPRLITQLGVYSFWSVGFVFAMASAARLTYSAAPDWLETIGTVFGIGLFVPVIIVAVDLTTMLRTAERSAVSAYLVIGTVGMALFALVNLGLGLRSANAVLGLTDWVYALDLLALFGVFTFWLLAFFREVGGSSGDGRGHVVMTAISVTAVVGALLVSGLQAGLTFVAGANSLEPLVGDTFEAVSGGRDGHLWVVFGGFALFAVTQLVFVARTRLRLATDAPEPLDEFDEAEPDASPDAGGDEDAASDQLGGLPRGELVSPGRIRSGAVGLFTVVALFIFVFPILEQEHRDATLLAEASRDYSADSLVSEGRDVYISEGCWYCHTQEVRAIVTDVGLGPVSVPGDYALEQPSVAGIARNGPDLMFAGSRGLDAATVAALLEDPRAQRSWASMPAHDYLSSDDLAAVAAYVSALTTYEFK